MTTMHPGPTPDIAARSVTCQGCGTAFECCLSGGCWCDAEPYRLPIPQTMPTEAAQDCLCPACLRKAAEELAAAAQGAATAK